MRLWTKAISRPNRHTRRSPLAGGRLLAGAAVTGLAVLSASSPASAQPLTWSIAPTPNPSTLGNSLQDVSCISATDCTAVGNDNTTRNVLHAAGLIESWNGTSWSVVPSPGGPGSTELSGVSCTSATACTAAGLQHSTKSGSPAGTLIEAGTAEG